MRSIKQATNDWPGTTPPQSRPPSESPLTGSGRYASSARSARFTPERCSPSMRRTFPVPAALVCRKMNLRDWTSGQDSTLRYTTLQLWQRPISSTPHRRRRLRPSSGGLPQFFEYESWRGLSGQQGGIGPHLARDSHAAGDVARKRGARAAHSLKRA